MPLEKAKDSSKKAVQKAVSKNMHELAHKGKKNRTHTQMLAIAINAAKKGK